MRILGAAFALAAAPLMAVSAIAAPVAAAPAKPLDRLVALLLPEEQVLRLAARTFETTLDRELGGAAAKHRGLKAHVAAELRPAFLKLVRKEIPSLRREIRTIAADGLTASETGEALAFFSSPTGAKLREQVYKSMAEKPNQSPDETQAEVMSAVMKNMKLADYPALIAFGASPGAGKIKALNPKIAAASKTWSDRLVARHGKRMRALAAAATRRYLKGRT